MFIHPQNIKTLVKFWGMNSFRKLKSVNFETICFSLGYGCPNNYNPADHYIFTLAIIPSEESESRKRLETICDAYHDTKDMDNGDKTDLNDFAEGVFNKRQGSVYKATWFQQLQIVLWRCFLVVIRDKQVAKVRLVQTTVSY